MTKLKPCPFCGGEATIMPRYRDEETGELKQDVCCRGCDCSTDVYSVEKQAIQAWNNRQPLQDVLEQLEKEKRIVDRQLEGATKYKYYKQIDLHTSYKNGLIFVKDLIIKALGK